MPTETGEKYIKWKDLVLYLVNTFIAMSAFTLFMLNLHSKNPHNSSVRTDYFDVVHTRLSSDIKEIKKDIDKIRKCINSIEREIFKFRPSIK